MNPTEGRLPQSLDWSGHIRRLAARYGAYPAVRTPGGMVLNYAELSARAHALAFALRDAGFDAGDPVASLLPNSLEAVWVSLGIKIAGCAEVALGWGYTADEIAWCSELSGARLLITPEERFALAETAGLRAMAPAQIVPTRGKTGDPIAQAGIDAMAPIPGSAPGRIQFTSGTTGRPKGVMTSHARRWIGEQMQKACLPYMPRPGSRILLMTPYVHGAGLLSTAWFDCGGEIVLHDGVAPDEVLPLLERCELDAMFAPPTVLAKLIASFGERRLSGLRCIFTGTQPLAEGLYQRARDMFGPVIRITYGKTECINPITTLAFEEIDEAFAETPVAGASCTGWPAPGVELRVGHPLAASPEQTAEGEIWLRAPQLSDGMITANGFTPHEPAGWHATGDLGMIDARGRLWLTGRVADVIKTGGYRVNPDEIEAHLAGMRRCAQISIVSLPSEYWGEVITAAVEAPEAGWREEMDERLKSLSRHKQPRLFVEFAALPRNPQGKISRRRLRDDILSRFSLTDGAYPQLKPVGPAGDTKL
jgi:acyl-CoA synthetase (AMP-forming)/AMP-acid ligase II